MRQELAPTKGDTAAALRKQIQQRKQTIQNGKISLALSADEEYALRSAAAILEDEIDLLSKEQPADSRGAFALLKADFDRRTKELKSHAEKGKSVLSHLFAFCEEVFGEGQEMVILVTELTINPYASRFLSRYGSEAYFRHNKELLFYERQKEIIAEMENLNI